MNKNFNIVCNRILIIVGTGIFLVSNALYAQEKGKYQTSQIAITPKVERVERSLSPKNIRKIGGFIGTRFKANLNEYLLVFDIDHYVQMFEEKQHRDWWWIGEQAGKWMESAVLAASQTEDMALREKAEKALARLIASQEPSGYLGITDPAVRTDQLPLRGMDAYELYFMLHGLITAYDLWSEEQALQAASRLGDYFVNHIGPGKAQFWPRPKGKTIAGHNIHYCLEGTLLANPMLRLYLATGDEKYLKWSKWVIDNIDLWSGHNTFSKLDQVAIGAMGVHELQPKVHSHTFHMNLLGFLRLYQITGDESLLRKVRGAWRNIAKRQMYITGGVSVDEYYRAGQNLPVSGSVVETCAMMSWMELSQYLLELTANPIYADVIERLLWNHWFAAQAVDGDSFRYYVPLNGAKPAGYYHGPDCCTASGPRMTAMIPTLFYAVGKDGIYINQFVESAAEIKLDSGNIVSLIQETKYPSRGELTFKINPQQAEFFVLSIRLPAWCSNPSLSINDKIIEGLHPGTYVKLKRHWQKGDYIKLTLPMQAKWTKRTHATEDAWALVRGPVVYAVDTVWWDSSISEIFDRAMPKDMSKVIGVVLDESNLNADLKSEITLERTLGLAYLVTIAFPNGQRAEVPALPFANVGRWYADPARKPDYNERRYHYAVWLPNVGSERYAEIMRQYRRKQK